METSTRPARPMTASVARGRTRHVQQNGSGGGSCSNGSTIGHQNGVHENGTRDVLQNGGSSAHAAPSDDSFLVRLFTRTVAPLFLMATCPNAVMLLWYTAVRCDGSFEELWSMFSAEGIVGGLVEVWRGIDIVSPLAVGVILGYMAWALLLMVLLPGPRVEGPVTPRGNVPVYTDNGFLCYVVTIVAFVALTFGLKQYGMSPTIVYDHFGEFLGTLTVFSHVLCIALHLKGLFYPSSSDSGTTGNLIFDYYWGTELYPRVFGIDVKVFTNCRFGMTVWPLLVLIFALKSYETSGFVDSMWVSVALQMIYFTKFFWWESGYMRTIDIMLDRAGFYICWGCLVFIPGLYASVSLYLVNHPVRLGPILSLAILSAGITAIVVNYLADKQKQDVRRTNAQCLVWGRRPEVIHATYTVAGERRTSLLLVSGYWGIARHFHYLPELFLAYLWTAPAWFTHVMPYSYLIFLAVLLIHRTFRDDEKCSEKYTIYWREYCNKVRYKIIPGVF